MQLFGKLTIDGTEIEVSVDPRPYKVYNALISQSGDENPTVAKLIENTADYSPVFVRDITGQYSAELPTTVTETDQVAVMIGNNNPAIAQNSGDIDTKAWIENHKILIQTTLDGVLVDGGLCLNEIIVKFL